MQVMGNTTREQAASQVRQGALPATSAVTCAAAMRQAQPVPGSHALTPWPRLADRLHAPNHTGVAATCAPSHSHARALAPSSLMLLPPTSSSFRLFLPEMAAAICAGKNKEAEREEE